MTGRERRVRELGRETGFDLVRITGAEPLVEAGQRYVEWVDAGRQGEMRWITRERAERSADPSRVLPEARAVICLGLSYWAGTRPEDSPRTGRVARYAWGRDYHAVLEEKLRSLAGRLGDEFGGEYRWYVDTGPLMDKALAARAGLGWYGKNTNLLTVTHGSFLFLGEIVTTLQLFPDAPLHQDCGRCRLCLVACPTAALGPDYSIDARRCISYLTIEHRGPIPLELRSSIGFWVFGCDICQDVCPPAMQPYLGMGASRAEWLADVRATVGHTVPAGRPADVDLDAARTVARSGHSSLDLLWLLRLSHPEYAQEFRGTAIKRAKVWMLRRNAAIALGNVGDEVAIEPLLDVARGDEHPIVRGHAVWALGEIARRLERPDIPAKLLALLETEGDPEVHEEILGVLGSK